MRKSQIPDPPVTMDTSLKRLPVVRDAPERTEVKFRQFDPSPFHSCGNTCPHLPQHFVEFHHNLRSFPHLFDNKAFVVPGLRDRRSQWRPICSSSKGAWYSS